MTTITNTTATAPKYRLAARRAGSVSVMRWDAGPAPRTGWWTPVGNFQTAADALREFPTAAAPSPERSIAVGGN